MLVIKSQPSRASLSGPCITLNAHRTNTTNLNQASQIAWFGRNRRSLEAVSKLVAWNPTRTIANLPLQWSTNKTTMTAESMPFGPSTSSDSKQQRLIDFIDAIQPVLQDYAERRRDQMAQPLSNAFEEGFELLSRKAKWLKHIGVNPENYHVEIGMAGFSGNWLERDLSATEKQHAGLSLLYALRRQAQTALPSWWTPRRPAWTSATRATRSTKFYPRFRTVIVLATMTTSQGLYQELQRHKPLAKKSS